MLYLLLLTDSSENAVIVNSSEIVVIVNSSANVTIVVVIDSNVNVVTIQCNENIVVAIDSSENVMGIIASLSTVVRISPGKSRKVKKSANGTDFLLAWRHGNRHSTSMRSDLGHPSQVSVDVSKISTRTTL